MTDCEIIFVDGVKTVTKHNNVFRVELMRLGTDGKPIPAIELLIPSGAIKTIGEALSKQQP